jgi:hypothetical protein
MGPGACGQPAVTGNGHAAGQNYWCKDEYAPYSHWVPQIPTDRRIATVRAQEQALSALVKAAE